MQGSPGSEAAAMAKEWIGALFVHGIGDHRTYEHLENEAHQIVHALKEPAGKILGLSGGPSSACALGPAGTHRCTPSRDSGWARSGRRSALICTTTTARPNA
jgi:hypothetical protein